MIGIALIYFIWKKLADLAFEFEKNRWLYGILGVVIYYASSILVAFITGIVITLIDPYFFEGVNETLLNLIFVPFGILGVYIFYIVLRKNWKVNSDAVIDQL